MFITKNGKVSKINPDTLPFWVSQGWSPDADADGVPDATSGGGNALAAVPLVRRYVTSADQAQQLAAAVPIAMGPVPVTSGRDVVVDTSVVRQRFMGGGAALTGSSVSLLMGMTKTQRTTVLKAFWGAGGASTVRISIGASDFEVSPAAQATLDEVAAGQTDPNLVNFSIQRESTKVALLLEILAINPRVKIFLCSWQPPGWMCTSSPAFVRQNSINAQSSSAIGATIGNAYSAYLVQVLQQLIAAGIPAGNLYQLSPQNEPGQGVFTTWPAGAMADFIVAYLGPALRAAGLPTKIGFFEDNWNQAYWKQVVAANADVLKWAHFNNHGYEGSAAVMSDQHAVGPNCEIHMTERRSFLADSIAKTHGNMAGLIIGSLREWANTTTLWNFALDPQGNPVVISTGRRGVVTVNLDGQGKPDGTVGLNPEFFAMLHVTRFVQPGAVVIGSNSFSGPYQGYVPPTALVNVAFLNPDGSIVVVAYNGETSPRTFTLEDGRVGVGGSVTMAAGELSTFVWGLEAAPTPATFTAPTAAPTLTVASAKGQVNITASPATDALPLIGVEIWAGDTSGAQTLLTKLPPGVTAFRDITGVAGTRFYSARTVTSGGYGPFSAEKSATTTAATAPAAPVLAVVGSTTAALSWPAVDPNGQSIIAVTVRRGTTSGGESDLQANLPGNTVSFVDTNPPVGSFYTIVVTNSVGSTTSNEVGPIGSAQRPVQDQVVATDNATSGQTAFTASVTPTAGLASPALIVSVEYSIGNNNLSTLTAVTSDGVNVPLTLVATDNGGGTNTLGRRVEMWAAVGIPTGKAITVTATPSAAKNNAVMRLATFSKVAQTSVAAAATAITGAGSNAQVTAVNVTSGATVNADLLIVSTSVRSVSAPTPTAGDATVTPAIGAQTALGAAVKSGTNLFGAAFTSPGTGAAVKLQENITTADFMALAGLVLHGA